MKKNILLIGFMLEALVSASQTSPLSINPPILLSDSYFPNVETHDVFRIFQLKDDGKFVQIRGNGKIELVNLKDRSSFTLRCNPGAALRNSVTTKNRIYYVEQGNTIAGRLFGTEFDPDADTVVYNVSEILKIDAADRSYQQNEFIRKSRTELIKPPEAMLKEVWIAKHSSYSEEIEVKDGDRNYFFNTTGKFQFDVNDVSGLTSIEACKTKSLVNSQEFLYLGVLNGVEVINKRMINITPILSGIPNTNNLYHGGLQTDYYQGWSWELADVRCLSKNKYVVFVNLNTYYEKEDPRFNIPIPFSRTQHVAIVYDGQLNYLTSSKIVFGDDVIILPNEEFITVFKDGFRIFRYDAKLNLIYDRSIAESDQSGITETAYDVVVDGQYLYACGHSEIKLNYGKKDAIFWKVALNDGKIIGFKLLKEPSLPGAFGARNGMVYFVTNKFLRSFEFEDAQPKEHKVLSPPVDMNGNVYRTTMTGHGQEWMAEDLRTAYFENGDKINEAYQFTVQDVAEPLIVKQHRPISQGYNWYAAVDSRNVCPAGWHLPSDEEWAMLQDYLGKNFLPFFNIDLSMFRVEGNTRSAFYWWSSGSVDDLMGSSVVLTSYSIEKGERPKKSGQRIRCVRSQESKNGAKSDNTQFDVDLLSLTGGDENQGTMPVYPGGEPALSKYISDNVVYPEMAKIAGVSGIVKVTYQVNSSGRVEDVRVSKSVDFFLDEEAVRVVSSITGYRPGTNGHGQPIRVELSVPVKFFL